MKNLRRELGTAANQLVGCIQVYGQSKERRLIVSAPNKAVRRSLLAEIKKLRNQVKASPHLSTTEK